MGASSPASTAPLPRSKASAIGGGVGAALSFVIVLTAVGVACVVIPRLKHKLRGNYR